ncbi:MAG: hypothetical protein ACLTDX_15360 [[Clostridium] innocuum]
MEAAHRIARASILHDIPLEINLNGFHYGKKTYRFSSKPGLQAERYPYPFREFWDIVSSYGCGGGMALTDTSDFRLHDSAPHS